MLKKTLALALAFALTVACLASCDLFGGEGDPDPKELMEAAEAQLEDKPYTATVQTKMTAKDPALAERIATLGETVMTVSSDGDDGFKVRLNANLGDIRVLKSYTAKGGMLYLEYILTVGEESAAVKEKASLESTELSSALSELGSGAEIGYADFSDVSLESSKEGYTVTCESASDEALAGAEMALASSLGEDMTLSLKELSYVATLDKDGALLSTVLTYTFSVVLDDVLYNMTSEVSTSYDYSSEVSVVAPDDADMYTEVAYGDLIR